MDLGYYYSLVETITWCTWDIDRDVTNYLTIENSIDDK